MSNLACFLLGRGNLEEAERLQRCIVTTSRETWGREHPDTLADLANRAATMAEYGRWGEAEESMTEILEASR